MRLGAVAVVTLNWSLFSYQVYHLRLDLRRERLTAGRLPSLRSQLAVSAFGPLAYIWLSGRHARLIAKQSRQ